MTGEIKLPGNEKNLVMGKMKQCTKKPKLLVILGAGSSIPYGMPSVSGTQRSINLKMIEWSDQWQQQDSSIPRLNPFKTLWYVSQRYYSQDQYHKGVYPNYESVLGNLTALVKWFSPATFGDPVIEEWIGETAFEGIGKLFGVVDGDRQAVRKAIMDQHQFLVEQLAKYFREKCKEVEDGENENFDVYTNFFRELKKYYDLGIYNLNHDNLALRALKESEAGVFTGFDDQGLFNPKIILERKELGFLYHLHGSVNFNLKRLPGSTLRNSIVWQNDLEKDFHDFELGQMEASPDAIRTPYTTFLEGGFKLEQLTPEPYQTFHASLTKHAHEADAFLFIGYGFGDSHVNRAIQNRFNLPHQKNHFPKVYIVDRGSKEGDYWIRYTRQVFYLSGIVVSENKDYAIYSRPNGEKMVKLDKRGTIKAFSDHNRITEWLMP